MRRDLFDALLRQEYAAREDAMLLDVGDVAKVLDVHRNIVRWFAESGRLPCQRTRRGTYLFRQGDVLAFHDARARARLADARTVRTPQRGSSYQLPLELVGPYAVKTPAPWTFATFRPRMMRAGLAKRPQVDRPVKDRGKSKGKTRVA